MTPPTIIDLDLFALAEVCLDEADELLTEWDRPSLRWAAEAVRQVMVESGWVAR